MQKYQTLNLRKFQNPKIKSAEGFELISCLLNSLGVKTYMVHQKYPLSANQSDNCPYCVVLNLGNPGLSNSKKLVYVNLCGASNLLFMR